MIRGRDTRLGEAGYCPACHQSMPDGPDRCLGMLPGVREACCGHGRREAAYVTYDDGRHLQGEAALRALHRPTWGGVTA